MMTDQLTVLVLTFNEAPNLERTLARLAWAREVLIVDSFSTDATLEIARRYPQARVVQRKFVDHTSQWNFGLDQVRTDWVLALDADYVLTEDLIAEIQALPDQPQASAYYAKFRYCIGGKPLRAALYPPRAVLFQRGRGRYVNDGHTQLLKTDGATGWLAGVIDHDDRKPLDRWLAEQNRYALAEAKHLREMPVAQMNRADRLRRRIVFAPLAVFLFTAFGKGLILDGWPGWYYIFQRTLAEILLSLRLIEQKLEK
jgi:glycosyltransferase involved in cell wall biosynthesis